MECRQRLHPLVVVFKEQRSSPLCEVSGDMWICIPISSQKNDFNPEAPALKRKKERKRWRKSFFLKNVVFYEHGFRSAGMFLPNAFEELVTVPTICSWLADGCWWFAHIFWRCLLKMQELHKSVLFPARRTLNPRHFTFKLQTWENHSIFEQGFPDATHNPWLDFPVAREASIYNPSHYCILCIYAVRV